MIMWRCVMATGGRLHYWVSSCFILIAFCVFYFKLIAGEKNNRANKQTKHHKPAGLPGRRLCTGSVHWPCIKVRVPSYFSQLCHWLWSWPPHFSVLTCKQLLPPKSKEAISLCSITSCIRGAVPSAAAHICASVRSVGWWKFRSRAHLSPMGNSSCNTEWSS